MRKIFIVFICVISLSCSSLDVEDQILPEGGFGRTGPSDPAEETQAADGQQAPGDAAGPQAGIEVRDGVKIVTVPVEGPAVVIKNTEVVERPVFVPATPATPAPARGRDAVTQSNGAGIIRPEAYSHAAMIYDYHPDQVYEVYTQPLRASDVVLEPGEKTIERPFVSDSERWLLGAGVSYQNGFEVQHIYIKPAAVNLQASLIINTDRRVYHFILRSYQDIHMPIVRFRYPGSGMPQNYAGASPSPAAQAPAAPPSPAQAPSAGTSAKTASEPGAVDPRYVSFNYRITWSTFSKPAWVPVMVYDDGKKTYVAFPDNVLQKQLPAVFDERANVINYRVAGNLVIIDRLVEELTVKMDSDEITITKKKE